MKILCLVKFTPDVDEFQYDHEKQTLVRENVKTIINPDDACALGFALQLKKQQPEQIHIEVVSMAPMSAVPLMEEILRRRVDKAVMLSDRRFAGSDTLATSRILGAYLKKADFDVILTGDHSADGDTAHIPSQLAEYLGIGQVSAIVGIDKPSFLEGSPLVTVDNDRYLDTYQLTFPAILSVSRASKIRLPFVRFADLRMDVGDKLTTLDLDGLELLPEQAGQSGSPTRVVRTWTRTYQEKPQRQLVGNDEAGVETVYRFLKEQGYLP